MENIISMVWKITKKILAGTLIIIIVATVFVTAELTIGKDKCQPIPRNTALNDDPSYINKHSAFPIKNIKVNDVNYAYIEAGQGPLVILIHGFPDTGAYTWEEVLPKLAAANFHAVAIFDRGYYPTDIPANGDYSIATQAKDVIALVKALGEQHAALIGQDWGADIAYAAANMDPVTITKIAPVAIPPPSVVKPTFQNFRCFPHFLVFQFGSLSAWYAKKDDFAYLQYLYHYWSPSWSVPKGQIDEMKDNFSKPGRLGAAIAYYPWQLKDRSDKTKQELYDKKITVPTMLFVGEEDASLRIGLFKNAGSAFSGPFQMVIIPHAGHFLHREQPEIFSQKVTEFLKQ